MKKEVSNTITNINLILTILIVLLHSNCITYANPAIETYAFIKKVSSFLTILCSSAVPTFFVISTFLFFRNFEMIKYKEKIKSRIKSLGIPYLFFSILFLMYTIILIHIPFMKGIETTVEPIKYDFFSIIKYIFLSEFNGTAWYIRDLLIFFIFSPIIYFLVNFLKKLNWIILIAIVAVNLFLTTSYYGCIYWLFLYYIVAYLTINNRIELVWNYLKKRKCFLVVISIGLILLLMLSNENMKLYYIYRMISPFILLTFCFKNKYLER